MNLLLADHARERLANSGPHVLSNTDLISVLLGNAASLDTKVSGAQTLTQKLMSRHRSLRALARCDPKEMVCTEGLSMDGAVLLTAAFELGRRVACERSVTVCVDEPRVVCQLLAQELHGLMRETFRVLLLDAKCQLIRIEEVAVGSLRGVVAHPREVFRPALMHSAHAIVVVHNHPSGDPTPGEKDKRLTKHLVAVGETLQIVVKDHIIIGGVQAGQPRYFSFKEAGGM